jgi:hypothetical protein
MSDMTDIYDRLRIVEGKQMTHEAVCAERYENIMKMAGEMKDDFKGLNGRLIALGILIMSGMAGILIKLVFS